jgi:hypothetical protein
MYLFGSLDYKYVDYCSLGYKFNNILVYLFDFFMVPSVFLNGMKSYSERLVS